MMTYERDARFILVREVEGAVEVVDSAPLALQYSRARMEGRNKNCEIDERVSLAVIVTAEDAPYVECLIDRRRCASELKYQLDPTIMHRLDKPAFRALVRLLADRDEGRKQASCHADSLARRRDELQEELYARPRKRKPPAKRTGKRGAK